MRAGKLNKVVTFERATESVSAAGSTSRTWDPLMTVRAEVRDVTAEEIAVGFGSAEKETAVFIVRWHPTPINTGDRVIYVGKPFSITNISEIGERRGWKIAGEAQ